MPPGPRSQRRAGPGTLHRKAVGPTLRLQAQAWRAPLPHSFSLSASSGHTRLNTSCSVTGQEGLLLQRLHYGVRPSGRARQLPTRPLPLGLRFGTTWQSCQGGQGRVPHRMHSACIALLQPSWAHPHRALPPTNVRFRPPCSRSGHEVNPRAPVSPGRQCTAHVCWAA